MFGKIMNLLSSVMLIVLMVLAAIMAGPYLIGCQNLSVVSGSMEPTIPVGGMVTVQMDAVPEEVVPGDVITFEIAGGEHLTTHRVMEVDQSRQEFITKGDANSTVDISPISFDRMKGKVVFSVPYLGFLITAMQSKEGILIIAGILIVMVLLTVLPVLFSKS